MNVQTHLGYLQGTGFQAVEMPYVHGAVSMVVVLPDAGTFPAFVAGLSQGEVASISAGLKATLVQLGLPRFTARTSLDLVQDLQAFGMADAFNPATADFSGMDGQKDLFISDVIQKAYVDVDESGTEAAAATGVSVGISAIEEPTPFNADRPFVYFIRDIQTGAVLFIGFVVDPSVVPS